MLAAPHTQRSLAAATGVSEQSIANYISGKTRPRQPSVRRALADELGEDVYATELQAVATDHSRLKTLRFLDATPMELAARLTELLRDEAGHPPKVDQSNVLPGHERWIGMPVGSDERSQSQA